MMEWYIVKTGQQNRIIMILKAQTARWGTEAAAEFKYNSIMASSNVAPLFDEIEIINIINMLKNLI